jgi:hypothetical protein
MAGDEVHGEAYLLATMRRDGISTCFEPGGLSDDPLMAVLVNETSDRVRGDL